MRAHISLDQFTNQVNFTGFLGSLFQIDEFESTYCLVCVIVELYINNNIIRHGLFNGKGTDMKIRRQLQSQFYCYFTVYISRLIYLSWPLFLCKINFLQTVKSVHLYKTQILIPLERTVVDGTVPHSLHPTIHILKF